MLVTHFGPAYKYKAPERQRPWPLNGQYHLACIHACRIYSYKLSNSSDIYLGTLTLADPNICPASYPSSFPPPS